MVDEKQMMHGQHYRGQNLRGWFATEKFRGCRAYWDGRDLWSRGGHRVELPSPWRAGLPDGFPLDCEGWVGRGVAGGVEECEAIQAITRSKFTDRIRLLIHDAPAVLSGWLDRMRAASAVLNSANDLVRSMGFVVIESTRQAGQILGEVHAQGGEGLMLREPHAAYRPGRHATLVKLKRPYYATFLGVA